MSERELDALIAEHVFGWRWLKTGITCKLTAMFPPPKEGLIIYNFSEESAEPSDATAERFSDWDKISWNEPEEFYRHPSRSGFPHYSTDWGAAGEVVERMADWDWDIGINKWSKGYDEPWQAELHGYPRGHFKATAKTAPKAICLAALKAVGIELGFEGVGVET